MEEGGGVGGGEGLGRRGLRGNNNNNLITIIIIKDTLPWVGGCVHAVGVFKRVWDLFFLHTNTENYT